MIKKFGMITVGVTAGLLVAAPLASAHEASGSESHQGSGDCSFVGGTGEGSSSGTATGVAAISGATVGGLGGNNVGNIADCSSFLNDNLNGNQVGSNNKIGDTEAPSLPQFPGAGDLGGTPTLPTFPTAGAPGVSAPSL